jgi:hypothetical protein
MRSQWEVIDWGGPVKTLAVAAGPVQGNQHFIVTVIPGPAAPGANLPGAVEVAQVEAILDFGPGNIAGNYFVAAGMNLQTINAGGATGIVVNPIVPTDLSRDDWLSLTHSSWFLPVVGGATNYQPISRRLSLSRGGIITVDEGKALILTVGYNGPALSTLTYGLWLRYKTRRLY